MRKDFPHDAPPGALLAALEARAQSDPVIAAEWAHAWRAWPEAGADARVRERFREWFLLERESEALGVPPAAAWAPRELGERDEDPWTRLLEAQFRVLSVDDSGAADDGTLTDLWSGQVFEEVSLPAEAAVARLLLARLAPQGTRGGELLPGWRAIADFVLADALAGDLARLRAVQPRARLSQRECELLLAPHWERELSARSSSPADERDRVRRLAEYLREHPQWSTERALGILQESGPAELLDRIAFETPLPLEPLRLLIAEWTQAQLAEVAPPPLADPEDPLEPESVEAALVAYDCARASGIGLRQAWDELQQALQLAEKADSEASEPWEEEGEVEAIGPESVPGLSFWIETWEWERKREGRPLSPAERRVATRFAQFAEGLHEGGLDAAEIHARDLWNFYASAPDGAELEARMRATADLVAWLRQEQGAFVMEDPSDWTERDLARLRSGVQLNERLRGLRSLVGTKATIAATDPPRVLSEQGDWVEVSGLPEHFEAPMRRGDLVGGIWTAGEFVITTWLPQPSPAADASAEA